MFFAHWVAPIILMLCGIFMIRMGSRWYRSGRPLKGVLDLLVGIAFLIIAAMLPTMG